MVMKYFMKSFINPGPVLWLKNQIKMIKSPIYLIKIITESEVIMYSSHSDFWLYKKKVMWTLTIYFCTIYNTLVELPLTSQVTPSIELSHQVHATFYLPIQHKQVTVYVTCQYHIVMIMKMSNGGVPFQSLRLIT